MNKEICEECYYVVNVFHMIVCRDCPVTTSYKGVRADLKNRGWNKEEVENEIVRLKRAKRHSIAKRIEEGVLYCSGEGETKEMFGRQFPINESIERFYE